MFDEIKLNLETFFQESGFDKHLSKIWVDRNILLCLDFEYHGIPFGFDLSLLTNKNILLEAVDRGNSSGFVAVATANRRQLLTANAPFADAAEHLRRRAAQTMADIDAFLTTGPKAMAAAAARPAPPARRVGVMTLPLNQNIGGNLQAFALMEALRNLGHSPVFITLKHPRDAEPKPLAPAKLNEPMLQASVGLGSTKPNTSFTDTYLVPISKAFDSTDLLARDIDRLGLDALIAGSDQIWRPRYAKTMLLNYFFDFLPAASPIRRISYAPSFGVSKWEYGEELTRDVARLIKRFDATSVREDRAVELCADHLGVKAEHVLDPTLLLAPDDYAPILSTTSAGPAVGQLVAYILDLTPDKTAIVDELSKVLALDAYTTSGVPFAKAVSGEADGEDKTVQRWLASLHDAKYVVTDSFHGMALAILFNKPFIAYGNPTRGMARFTSLLKMVGLEDRLAVTSADIDLAKMVRPIDWAAVNARIAALRERSYRFLETALSGEGRADAPDAKAEMADDATIPLDFTPNTEAWSVARDGTAAVMAVAPGSAVLGNFVACPLPMSLESGARYRLTVTWALTTTSPTVKPCIRNPRSGKNHVIATINVDEAARKTHGYLIEFTAPGDGFTQFVLGAASFTGEGGGVRIEALSLKKTADAPPVAPPAPGAAKPAPAPAVTVAPPVDKNTNFINRAKELALLDTARYSNAFVNGNPIGGRRARLMYAAHAIEKGLSHSNFRAGFGKTAIERLAKETQGWIRAGHSVEDPFFKSGISVMRVYFDRHKALDVDVSPFWALFTPQIQRLIAEAELQHGGVVTAKADREPVSPTQANRPFLDVVYGRRSVREFTSVPIDLAQIKHAVSVASQAPSVCNRQAPRVHVFDEPQQVRALVDLQGGFGGYRKPPVLLLVTSDLTAFVHAKERNQAFVDGGLFLMSLLLGLEHEGLGACPLNTTMEASREADIRKVLQIPDTEVLISFVAVGHYDPSVLVPRSLRYPVEDLLFVHK